MLCDVETDKATMAWENQDDGFVAKLLKEAGAKVCPDPHRCMACVTVILRQTLPRASIIWRQRCSRETQDIPVGTPVLILVEDEENLAAFKDYKPDSSSASAQQSEAAESGSEQQSSSGQCCAGQRTCVCLHAAPAQCGLAMRL